MGLYSRADYGVQLSDTEGYSYFINECLEYGTPVICTDFPSAHECLEDGKSGYILDMDLKNLDIDKIVNHIPINFKYTEKGKVEDWIKILDKKEKEKSKDMYKIIAKQNYTDKRPELIEKYNDGQEINYNIEGNATIKRNDVYIINDTKRAEEIKASGFAEVKKIKEVETATAKAKTETAVKKTRKVKNIEIDLDKGTVKED